MRNRDGGAGAATNLPAAQRKEARNQGGARVVIKVPQQRAKKNHAAIGVKVATEKARRVRKSHAGARVVIVQRGKRNLGGAKVEVVTRRRRRRRRREEERRRKKKKRKK